MPDQPDTTVSRAEFMLSILEHEADRINAVFTERRYLALGRQRKLEEQLAAVRRLIWEYERETYPNEGCDG